MTISGRELWNVFTTKSAKGNWKLFTFKNVYNYIIKENK